MNLEIVPYGERTYRISFGGEFIGSITNYGDVFNDLWTISSEVIDRISSISLETCMSIVRNWAAKQLKERPQVVTVLGFGKVSKRVGKGCKFAAVGANVVTQSVLVDVDGAEVWVNHVPYGFSADLRKGDVVELYFDLGRQCLRPCNEKYYVAA